MFTVLRKSTVIFLVILQLLAPLVHAHAGEKGSDVGLHIHGLEMHEVEHDSFVFQAAGHDFHADGVVIGVAAGIKDKHVNTVADPDNGHYLHQQAVLFNAVLFPFDTNFSPQAQQFVCRLFIPSLSPRAPPA